MNGSWKEVSNDSRKLNTLRLLQVQRVTRPNWPWMLRLILTSPSTSVWTSVPSHRTWISPEMIPTPADVLNLKSNARRTTTTTRRKR
ncbi:hypothetical protein BaRGS_00007498 [Batillaria attramentaria]|uniref:Uncharacterized protein n=1 Tax=Batillaria attramentaria TaxID=370345 RepID=A0ABD0LQ56_9CAEN